MRIATITCHDVYNYGASLQAFALQEYCRSLGHEYTIIDYKPSYQTKGVNFSAVDNPRFNKPLLKQAYIIAKLPERLLLKKRYNAFNRFKSKFYNLSNLRYTCLKDFTTSPLNADLYIAGSDQIWNTMYCAGCDPVFYLEFAKGLGRRISYAASFATEQIYKGKEDFVSERICSLDAISLRETSGIELANRLGRNDAVLVSDPVFLLSKENWISLLSTLQSPKKEYIVVYDCEKNETLKAVAEKLKDHTGLPIYSLSPIKSKYADIDFRDSGPLEFLSLISGAKYVVANSYHALAFSLIFEKQFFIVNRKEAINTRMRDLLNYLNLSSRLLSLKDEVTDELLDFDKVNSNLKRLIDDSKSYLNQQIRLATNQKNILPKQ